MIYRFRPHRIPVDRTGPTEPVEETANQYGSDAQHVCGFFHTAECTGTRPVNR